MSYQKKIDDDYQKQIDEFIAKNGVKQLSNIDNKIAEAPDFRKGGGSQLYRIKKSRKLESSAKRNLERELLKGDVVKYDDCGSMGFGSKRVMTTYVAAMRKAGWELENLPSVGYRLIKKGGYFHT